MHHKPTLITITFLFLAVALNAQTRPVSLSAKNAPIKTVLAEIQQKSGYRILYNDEVVADDLRVSVNAENVAVKDLLNIILTNTGLTFVQQSDELIVITKKEFTETSTSNQIIGTVVDENNEPVPFANVVQLALPDSTFINGVSTGVNGRFSLERKSNNPVLLEITFLGYQRYQTEITDNKTGVIHLVPETTVLGEVVVTGQKRQSVIRFEKGKIVFYPENSIFSQGGNALDILKKTPGVFVDAQNNINIGGNSGILITINGKQTNMQKEELVAYLRTLPSGNIATVEVMNTPSAQYDAQGSAGVLNIKTKSSQAEGFFISLNNGVAYGVSPKQNTEFVLNHNTQKLSLFGTYNHMIGNYMFDYGMTRTQEKQIFDSSTDDTDKRKTVSASFGGDYRFNSHHTLGARLTANALFGPGQTITTTNISDSATQTPLQILKAENNYYMQKANRYGGNLYYLYSPTERLNYSFDIDYSFFDGGSGNLQPNAYYLPLGELLKKDIYHSVNKRDIHIFAVALNQDMKTDNGELKTGLKYSNVNANNDFKLSKRLNDNRDIIDNQRSNTFNFQEQIAAAFVQYSHSFGEKISVEVGVRAEYTLSQGLLTPYNAELKQQRHQNKYFNLFPSLMTQYLISERQRVSLSFASRINRPAYQNLNPFEYLLDELSYWKGNPFLKPQHSHKITVNYTFGKTTLLAAFTQVNDYSAQITDTLSNGKVAMTPLNIGTQKQLSIGIFQEISPTHWWNINLNAQLYRLHNQLQLPANRQYQNSKWATSLSVQNSFVLPFNFKAELHGIYSSRRQGESYEIMKPSGYIDAGISRRFLNNKLAVSLSATDILWTNRWDSYGAIPGLIIENRGRGESRQLKLNITYKLGTQVNKRELVLEEIKRL